MSGAAISNAVARALADVAERAAGAADNIAHAYRRRYRGVNTTLDGGIRSTLSADAEFGNQIGRLSFESSPLQLSGTDVSGRPLSFRADQVRSLRVWNEREGTMGVSFVTDPSDPMHSSVDAWSRMRIRGCDREFWSTRSDPTNNVWEPVASDDAPWRVGPRASTKKPVYVISHGNKRGYFVEIQDDTTGTHSKVLVDGPTYGGLVRADVHYREAASERSDGPILSMSCLTGHPDADAGSSFADDMHTHNENRDIYSPKGCGALVPPARTERSDGRSGELGRQGRNPPARVLYQIRRTAGSENRMKRHPIRTTAISRR
ncbi:hypothetical protein [Nocardia amamiensis]|uniref:hypothetical protein n=1 Tax=Nocardia amamiensis TaxID=404578 RepID=UPI000A6599C2|nr:hypothetical protein [Nocardia amamiensis]